MKESIAGLWCWFGSSVLGFLDGVSTIAFVLVLETSMSLNRELGSMRPHVAVFVLVLFVVAVVAYACLTGSISGKIILRYGELCQIKAQHMRTLRRIFKIVGCIYGLLYCVLFAGNLEGYVAVWTWSVLLLAVVSYGVRKIRVQYAASLKRRGMLRDAVRESLPRALARAYREFVEVRELGFRPVDIVFCVGSIYSECVGMKRSGQVVHYTKKEADEFRDALERVYSELVIGSRETENEKATGDR